MDGDRIARDRLAARERLAREDAEEPHSSARERFHFPRGVIYLDGNSLGPLQPAVAARLARTVGGEWGDGLIRSWNEAGWVDLPARVAARIAPLIGAEPTEVTVADTTSTNLFKALGAALEARPDRSVILTDSRNFPTDVTIADGVARFAAGDRRVRVVEPEEVEDALGPDVAVLALTHVDYRSGLLHDAGRLTAAAHDHGALAVWDLSHSAGAVRVDLHDWDADLAVGCTYKYLNGGPGSPAYVFVASRHNGVLRNPIQGWFGHGDPFRFSFEHRPAPDASAFLTGTPTILALAGLDTALEVWEDLDLDALWDHARTLTSLFIDLVEQRCDGLGLELRSPRRASQRGAQVSLSHPRAGAVMRTLIDRGVIGDHRPPDLLRFGFAPLYIRRVDVHDAVEILREVLADRVYEQERYASPNRVP